jgi:hypothetical protein
VKAAADAVLETTTLADLAATNSPIGSAHV